MIPTGHNRVPPGKERWASLLVLLLGLIHGLVYIFAVPPWEHYDEPTHFEYAWLIANEEGLPAPEEHDQAFRREVLASMEEHGFFNQRGSRPSLLNYHNPVWIGVSQTSDLPLYYLIAALPLRFLPTTDITLQLYSVRFVSLGFFLLILLAAIGIAQDLFAPGSPLRWLFPLSLVLMPGVIDTLTAVNNDVGAAAFFSLVLWGSTHMLKRGFAWFLFLPLLLFGAAAFYTKSTSALAVLLLAPVVILSILRGARRWAAWTSLSCAMVIGVIIIFNWGDAAQWVRLTVQDLPTRTRQSTAPHGQYVFQIGPTGEQTAQELIFVIPNKDIEDLRGKNVIVGAWMWASTNMKARTPTLVDSIHKESQVVDLSTHPEYFAYKTKIRQSADRVYIQLAPTTYPLTSEVVYYDGVVVTEGKFPIDQPPDFTGKDGRDGQWGEMTFRNLVSNGSAESGFLYVKPEIEKQLLRFFPSRPSLIIASILNPNMAPWYYQSTARNLMYTFWGKFGWGQVPLRIGRIRPYPFLTVVTILGVAGTVSALWRRRHTVPWDTVLLYGTIMVLVWGAAFFRGIESLVNDIFIPGARYAIPVILLSMLILVVGWWDLAQIPIRLIRRSRWWAAMLIVVFFLLLDVYAVLSILRFYHPS